MTALRQNISDSDGGKAKNASKKAVNIGLFFNIFLALSKTFAGIFGHSRALLADGINSSSDVIYYIVVKIFIDIAHKPADEKHPYGHRQMESIAALIVGAFVITTSMAVFWDSVVDAFNIFSGEVENSGPAAYVLCVAAATAVIKAFLYFFTKRTGERYGSSVIMALACDHRNDIFSSIAVSIGIIFSLYGWKWFDPLAGAIVAILILKTGIKIIMESSDELMFTVPDKKLDSAIRGSALSVRGVLRVGDIKTHRFGPYLVANITIGIDGTLSVTEGDKIAGALEKQILESIDGMIEVYVHFHPHSLEDANGKMNKSAVKT
jgi:cation diffusion facilitator family transporter